MKNKSIYLAIFIIIMSIPLLLVSFNELDAQYRSTDLQILMLQLLIVLLQEDMDTHIVQRQELKQKILP